MPLFMVASVASGQTARISRIGDPAPPLKIKQWVKGEGISHFEKGKVYVVDFWATWCKPCLLEFPHLSVLAAKYKDRVVVCDIDVKEQKSISIAAVKAFVDKLGDKLGENMNFHVGVEDGNFMETAWLTAFGNLGYGIPRAFVIDATGKVAWIGHPAFGLDTALDQIVHHKWDLQAAAKKMDLDQRLKLLDISVRKRLNPYIQKPDSALIIIHQMVRKEPQLKYAPQLGYYTFLALLKTHPQKACEYGEKLIKTTTYQDPGYDAVINGIKYAGRPDLPLKIFHLGAAAYMAKIDHYKHPELIAQLPDMYDAMARLHWQAGETLLAINAGQKAIELAEGRDDLSGDRMAAFKRHLQQYQNSQ